MNELEPKKHSATQILILSTAVILFWRGIWGLLDISLFPNNELMSYLVSLLLGLLVLWLNHFQGLRPRD